jgi:transposase-like protein
LDALRLEAPHPGRRRRHCCERVLHGGSTRDVGKITAALIGEQVSRSMVSRVAKSPNEKVEELRKAPIAVRSPYLWLP